jgi:hypothetical protein
MKLHAHYGYRETMNTKESAAQAGEWQIQGAKFTGMKFLGCVCVCVYVRVITGV